MPDFSAIGDLLGGITSILDGIVGLTGSLTGEGTLDALEGVGSSFRERAAEWPSGPRRGSHCGIRPDRGVQRSITAHSGPVTGRATSLARRTPTASNSVRPAPS